MKKIRFIYLCILIFALTLCIFSGWIYNKKSYAVFDKNMSYAKNKSNPGEAVMVNSTIKNSDFLYDFLETNMDELEKMVDEELKYEYGEHLISLAESRNDYY